MAVEYSGTLKPRIVADGKQHLTSQKSHRCNCRSPHLLLQRRPLRASQLPNSCATAARGRWAAAVGPQQGQRQRGCQTTCPKCRACKTRRRSQLLPSRQRIRRHLQTALTAGGSRACWRARDRRARPIRHLPNSPTRSLRLAARRCQRQQPQCQFLLPMRRPQHQPRCSRQ